MPFDAKTYDELVEIEKDEYRSRIRTPEGEGPDLSVGSDYDIEARVHAVPAFGTQAHAIFLSKQILPDTAEASFLVKHAALRGVEKQLPTAASGRIHIGLDGGSPPLIQAAGSVVTSLAGREYTLDEAATVALPAWTGKTVRSGMTRSRVQVLPDVTGMERGHRISISSVERTIVRVLPSIQSIEVDPPFDTTYPNTTAITAVASAFALASSSVSGNDTNQEPGVTGTLTGPTSGLSASVEFVEMTGGRDEQTPASLRQSVLDVMAVRPASGNLEQWRKWAKETPGVGVVEAFIYPNLRGLGTVTVVPFGDVGSRKLGTERNPEVLSYLKSQYGFDDDVEVLQFSDVGLAQGLQLTVKPGVGYEPDADIGLAGLPLHGSTASTVTRLQMLNEADLDYWQVGDRIVVPVVVAGEPSTEERVIQDIDSAGAGDYRIDLSVALSAVPALSELVYSGGPLFAPITTAAQAYFDTLGPGDTVPATRWPASVDAWQGDIVLKQLENAVQDVVGVRDHTLVSPTANVVTPALFVQRLGGVRILWDLS